MMKRKDKFFEKFRPNSFSPFFFRFQAPNSNEIFSLTQDNFEDNSANFLHLTQNFGILKQKRLC